MTDHPCGGCGGCGGGHAVEPQAPVKASMNPLSQVKQVIGIVSGKGGTGKSLVTGLLSSGLLRRKHSVAVLDADIACPAIPQMFDLPQGATRGEAGLYPALTESGLRVMSISLLTEKESDLITTRGASMAAIVEQLFSNLVWDSTDYLLLDLPPGLGDVAQLAFERLPLDGLIVVTTPQELVGHAVRRTIRLAQAMDVPILGLVENFSKSFGESATDAISREFDLPILDRLPLDPQLSAAADGGKLEALATPCLSNTIQTLESL